MNMLTKKVLALAIGVASTAQAQPVIVIEQQREVVDPSALIGEDSGSFYLARQTAATPRMGSAPTDARPIDLTAALVSEDSGSSYFARLPMGPGVAHEVVVAELDQARASGQLAALVSEDSGSAWLARSRSGLTTADLGDRQSTGEALAMFEARPR